MISEKTKKEAQELAQKRNASLEKAARTKFAKGPIPKERDQIVYLTNSILMKLASVRNGSAPDAFGSFALDSLARILSTCTCLMFDGWSVDSRDDDTDYMDDTEDVDVKPKDILVPATLFAGTDEFNEWAKLVAALKEYLYDAATFAKSLKSTSARLYLRAWLTLNWDDDPIEGDLPYATYSQEDALKVVRLLRVAGSRLRVDAELADLPKFKPVKPSSAKARKSRTAKKS